MRRSLTCCVYSSCRAEALKHDQINQHLNALGLLPSEEASQEVLLGRLVDDLDDFKKCQGFSSSVLSINTIAFSPQREPPPSNPLTYRGSQRGVRSKAALTQARAAAEILT